ncbi:MAG: DsbA family protein [Bdellovibrionales bacterium]|nr:DsbA family protein [Bdellovibrionales bacterium]
MKKIITIVTFFALIIFVVFAFNYFSSQNKTQYKLGLYKSGPFYFRVHPIEKLELAAQVYQQTFSFTDLTKRSPVLIELAENEAKLIADAAIKKSESLAKTKKFPKIKIYLPKPSENFNWGQLSKKAQLEFSDSISTDTHVLVTINDQPYSRGQLLLNQVQLSLLQTQQFYERLRVLQSSATRYLLLKQAKEQRTTIESLINEQIYNKRKEVTDQEVVTFALSKGVDLSKSNSKTKSIFKNILTEHQRNSAIDSYIAAHFPNEELNIYFQPPNYKIPLSEKKAIISENTTNNNKATLFVFSSFNCGTCKLLAEDLDEIRQEYSHKIRIAFIHLFPTSDWRSRLTAEASFCVNEQNSSAFWDLFKKVSQAKESIDEQKLVEIVKSTNVNYDKFNKCFVGQNYKKQVIDQVKYASDLGVTNSPTVIIGTEVLNGTILKPQLEQAVNADLF